MTELAPEQEVKADAEAQPADDVDSKSGSKPRRNARASGRQRVQRGGGKRAAPVVAGEPEVAGSGPGLPRRPDKALDTYANRLFPAGDRGDSGDGRSSTARRLILNQASTKVYRCGHKPIKVPGVNPGDPAQLIEPGEIVPGTETWPRLETWVRTRRLIPA